MAKRRAQKGFLLGLGLLDGVLAGVSFLLGYPLAGWVFVVAGLAAAGIGSVWNQQSTGSGDIPSARDVNTPTKSRLKPIMKLREEIHALLSDHPENPVLSALSMDTQVEVDAIAVRAVDLLEARRRVQKLLGAVYPSRSAADRLQTKLANESDPATKESTAAALAARKEEVKTLESLELMTKRLDANLDEAESTLAELRSQIVSAAAAIAKDGAEEELDPFKQMTERLRRISSTMEESIEVVANKNWA
jgi:hypothetical protein